MPNQNGGEVGEGCSQSHKCGNLVVHLVTRDLSDPVSRREPKAFKIDSKSHPSIQSHLDLSFHPNVGALINTVNEEHDTALLFISRSFDSSVEIVHVWRRSFRRDIFAGDLDPIIKSNLTFFKVFERMQPIFVPLKVVHIQTFHIDVFASGHFLEDRELVVLEFFKDMNEAFFLVSSSNLSKLLSHRKQTNLI